MKKLVILFFCTQIYLFLFLKCVNGSDTSFDLDEFLSQYPTRPSSENRSSTFDIREFDMDMALLNVHYSKFLRYGSTTSEWKNYLKGIKRHLFNTAYKYKSANITDPVQKRAIEVYLQAGIFIFSDEVLEQLEELHVEFSTIYHAYNDEFLAEVTKQPIDSLERDIELQNKWKIMSEKCYPQMKNVLDKYYKIIEENFKEKGPITGNHDSLSFWKYINGYHQMFSTDEYRKLWRTELKVPYHKFMSFMRKDFQIYSTYTGIEEDGPMPAYIFDLIFDSYRENSTNIQTAERAHIIIDEKSNRLQEYTARTLTLEAENFFHKLGFPDLGSAFWARSLFEDVDSHPHTAFVYYDVFPSGILAVDIRATKEFTTFQKIVDVLRITHQEQLMQNSGFPRILWDINFIPFRRAFNAAITLAATPLSRMSEIGFLKAELKEAEIIEWMKGVATTYFPLLASGMAMGTWSYDILERKIGIKKRNCEYWNRRLEYEWVVPKTYKPEDVNAYVTFDAFNVNQARIQEYNFDQLTDVLLQYQIFSRLCEVAGKFNHKTPLDPPMYECDIGDSKEAGEIIRTVVGYGSFKTWRELLDIIMGTPNSTLSAKGFLGYLAPLLNVIDKKHKKGKSPMKNETSINFCRK